MQHKSLLAALMVGVLALASCVKNEESQSVTDMRNARADEIKSQAELNRANAQAAITLAQAQKAIAEAQAKLLEAQAAIAEAEAAKIAVEAELAGIEVQIAAVKLEVEKVNLQAKKAELEALKAKYEAEIAKYNAEKQEAINKLEAAEAQAEIDEIKAQIELLKQEEKLLKAAGALSAEQQKQIGEAWNNYAAQVEALNKAQTALISKMAQLAKLQAGEDTAEEILAKQIQDKAMEIMAKKLYIAELEEKVNMSAAEIDAMLTLANAELADAFTNQLQAQEATKVLEEQLAAKQAAMYVYEQGWDSFISWFEGLLDEYDIYSYDYNGTEINLFEKYELLNPETQRYEVGIKYFFESADPYGNIAHYNTFVPLYTSSNKWNWYVDDAYVYPSSDEGEVPANWGMIGEYVYTPAKIYFDNVYELINVVASIEAEQYEDEVYEYLADGQFYTEYIQKKQAVLAAEIEKQTAFVNEAAPVVIPAYQAYNSALNAYLSFIFNGGNSSVDCWVAYDNYRHYMDVHNSTTAARDEMNKLVAVKDAITAVGNAQKNFDAINELLYGTVPDSVTADGEGGGEGATEGLIAKVARLENAAYEAGKVSAEKLAALAEPKKAWEDKEETLKKAVADAEEAVADKEKEIVKAQDEEDAALEAYHKAVILYTADPKGEGLEQAMKDAETAWKDAQKKVTDLQAELPDLEKAVADAQAAKAKVFDPYKEAQDAYDEAHKIYTELKAEWTEAKETLGERSDEPSRYGSAYARFKFYKASLEVAIQNLEQAEKDLKEAQDKNLGDEELNNLRMAWYELEDIEDELYQAYSEASDEYYALVYGDPWADPVVAPVYPDFWNTYYHVTPGASVAFPEMKDYCLGEWGPGQNLARYVWYGERLDYYQETYTEAVYESDYMEFVEEVNGFMAHIAEYEAEEPAYLDHIEEMQALSDAINLATIAEIDAKNAVAKAQTAKNALIEIKALKMYGTEPGVEASTVAEFEQLIEKEKKELVDLEKDLQHLINELYFGKKNPTTGEYTAAKIAELQNDIEKLQNEIEFRSEMIDYYLGIITALLGEDGGIE